METATQTLRRMVRTCGKSRYSICKATGIDNATLSRFVMQGAGLRSGSIDKLIRYFGLVLAPKSKRKGR